MGLASQEQIVQKVSERFPTFGYNSNKEKVVWIDFPIEIIIRNKTNSNLFANSASYYGYVKHFDIHHKDGIIDYYIYAIKILLLAMLIITATYLPEMKKNI